MAFYQFRDELLIPASPESVWDFMATPRNLSHITPDKMDFQIITQNLPEKMYQGMIIAYTVKPILGIKMKWVTEITHIQEGAFFVDEQRLGPYTMWHHQHHIQQSEQGTLMTDIVSYIPPFGPIGALANTIFIKKQIEAIFEYRTKAVLGYFTKGTL